MGKQRSATETIAVVGGGLAGFHVSVTLAQFAFANRFKAFKAGLVDFSKVSRKDVCKGFGVNRVGEYKVEAIFRFIKEQYGDIAACCFRTYVADAQSVPGLIRESDVVFNGLNSGPQAAAVSEEARNSLEIRMITGMSGPVPVHTVEVLPPGFVMGETSYDTAAWADASRWQGLFGSTVDSIAGVAQPFGTLAPSIGFNAWTNSRQRPRKDHT